MRTDLSATELRRGARREPDRSAAARMQAIANALEGMTLAEAARLAGMERQALRDAVVRYKAEGLAGLHNRPRPGPRSRLTEDQLAHSCADWLGSSANIAPQPFWLLATPCSRHRPRPAKR